MQSCASTGVPSPAGTPPLWRGRRWEERSKRLIDRLQHSSVAEGDNAWLKSAKLLKHFAFELWVQIAGLLLLDFLCSWASVYLLSKCVTQFLTFYAVVPESSLQRRVKLSKASHETFFNTGERSALGVVLIALLVSCVAPHVELWKARLRLQVQELDIPYVVNYLWTIVTFLFALSKLYVFVITLRDQASAVSSLGLCTLGVAVSVTFLLELWCSCLKKKYLSERDLRVARTKNVMVDIRSIRLAGWENFAFDHIKEARGKEMALRTRRMLLFGTASGVSVSTDPLLKAAVLSSFAFFSLSGTQEVSPEAVFAVLQVVSQVVNPLLQLSFFVNSVIEGEISVRRYSDFMSYSVPACLPRALENVAEANSGDEAETSLLLTSSHAFLAPNLDRSEAVPETESYPIVCRNVLFAESFWHEKTFSSSKSVPAKQCRFVTAQVPCAKSTKEKSPFLSAEKVNVNIQDHFVRRGECVVLTWGPGDRKSLVLLALLGEVPLCEGYCCVQGGALALEPQHRKLSVCSTVTQKQTDTSLNCTYSSNLPGCLGYVSQAHLWVGSGTVRSAIVFGRPYTQRHYQRVVDACGLDRDIANWALEGGDNFLLVGNGDNVSTGQKQRIALARALYGTGFQPPTVCLLDNPLEALDVETKYRICNALFGAQGLLRHTATMLIGDDTLLHWVWRRHSASSQSTSSTTCSRGVSFVFRKIVKGRLSNCYNPTLIHRTLVNKYPVETSAQLASKTLAKPGTEMFPERCRETSVEDPSNTSAEWPNTTLAERSECPYTTSAKYFSGAAVASSEKNPADCPNTTFPDCPCETSPESSCEVSAESPSAISAPCIIETSAQRPSESCPGCPKRLLGFSSFSAARSDKVCAVQSSTTEQEPALSKERATGSFMPLIASSVSQNGNPLAAEVTSLDMLSERPVETRDYLWYLKRVGSLRLGVLVCLTLVSELASIFGLIWVTYWTAKGSIYEAGGSESLHFYSKKTCARIACVLFCVVGLTVPLSYITQIYGCLSAAQRIHNEALRAMLSLPYYFYSCLSVGSVLNRLTTDLHDIDSNTLYILFVYFSTFCALVLNVVCLNLLNSCYFILTPLLAFSVYRTVYRLYQPSSSVFQHQKLQNLSLVCDHFLHALTGSVFVRLYKAEDFFLEDNRKLTQALCYAEYLQNGAKAVASLRIDLICLPVVLIPSIFPFGLNSVLAENSGSFSALRAFLANIVDSPRLLGLGVAISLKLPSLVKYFLYASVDRDAHMCSVVRVAQLSDVPALKHPLRLMSGVDGKSLYNAQRIELRNLTVRHLVPTAEKWTASVSKREKSVAWSPETVAFGGCWKYSSSAVQGVTETLKLGNHVAVVGHTGAGKSSLLLGILYYALVSEKSSVVVDEHLWLSPDVTQLCLQRYGIATLPREPCCIDGWTVKQYLDPKDAFDQEAIESSVSAVGLTQFVTELPYGYLTLITSASNPDIYSPVAPGDSRHPSATSAVQSKVTTVSGKNGLSQMSHKSVCYHCPSFVLRCLTLARIILHRENVRLLLVDEPPSGHKRSGSNLTGVYRTWFPNAVVLLTTHEAAFVRQCDSAWLLAEGRLTACLRAPQRLTQDTLRDMIKQSR